MRTKLSGIRGRSFAKQSCNVRITSGAHLFSIWSAPPTEKRMRKALGYGAIILCLLLIAAGIYADWYVKTLGPRIKQRVVAAVADRFDADVTLDGLQVSIFPEPNVTGECLSIRHRQWSDPEPLLYIKRFNARTNFQTLLARNNRV